MQIRDSLNVRCVCCSFFVLPFLGCNVFALYNDLTRPQQSRRRQTRCRGLFWGCFCYYGRSAANGSTHKQIPARRFAKRNASKDFILTFPQASSASTRQSEILGLCAFMCVYVCARRTHKVTNFLNYSVCMVCVVGGVLWRILPVK